MITPDLKPIQTSYRGYLFRSRLEARWAVFFDSLGIKYEYEKEGFDLDSAGWYLPDFWLPDYTRWIEIKGIKPSEDESTKLKTLVMAGKHPAFLFVGMPWWGFEDGEVGFAKECDYELNDSDQHLIVRGTSFECVPTDHPESYLARAMAAPDDYGPIEDIRREIKYQCWCFACDINDYFGSYSPFRGIDQGEKYPARNPTYFHFSKDAYRRALRAMKSARFEHDEREGSDAC